MSTLTGKIALVTGGTTGIGLAAARLFHEQGAQVIVTGRNPESLAQARKELPQDVIVQRADAASVADAETLAADIKARFGRLDIAFLNAGIARFAPLEALDEGSFDEMIAVNVKGVLFTLQKLLPLLPRGASVIVNTSVVSQKGIAAASAYTASKGAVGAVVRSLAVELAPRGIRVNAISPGPIETPIYRKLGFPAEALAGFQADMTAKVPLSRFGAADEVARAALFLATPGASYVTGSELPVDGGVGIA